MNKPRKPIAPSSWRRKDWFFRATKAFGNLFLLRLFRLETKGLENLPHDSAFVLLPKHQRWEDIPLLSLATPRPLYYVAKHELFATFISNWFLRSLGGIPLNRKRPLESRRSLQAIIEYLKEGEGMVVFPEGTYYRNRMGPGHPGIVRLILSRLSLPFIPVGMSYANQKGRVLVRICFGEPSYGDSSVRANEFFAHIMARIATLSGL